MVIHVPVEIEEFEPDLKFFFDLMVRKLHINRHKGFIKGKRIVNLQENFTNEVIELQRALNKKAESQFNVALECVDVANQSFLLALACLNLTKEEYHGIVESTNEKIEKIINCPEVDRGAYDSTTKRG